MTADDYRNQAAELRREAARTARPDLKELLLLTAANLDKLADSTAELERGKRPTKAPTADGTDVR